MGPFTKAVLEHAVCGREEVDLSMLKKVVRYGINQFEIQRET